MKLYDRRLTSIQVVFLWILASPQWLKAVEQEGWKLLDWRNQDRLAVTHTQQPQTVVAPSVSSDPSSTSNPISHSSPVVKPETSSTSSPTNTASPVAAADNHTNIFIQYPDKKPESGAPESKDSVPTPNDSTFLKTLRHPVSTLGPVTCAVGGVVTSVVSWVTYVRNKKGYGEDPFRWCNWGATTFPTKKISRNAPADMATLLITTIRDRYADKTMSDDPLEPMRLFLIDIDQEKKTLNRFLALATWSTRLGLSSFMNIDELVLHRTKERLFRIDLLRKTIATWVADMQNTTA